MGGSRTVVVVGAGIFGVTAADALCARGYRTTLIDPGPVPHPLAASTDISKAVRIDYGADEFFTELGERAIDGWRDWNRESSAPLFHEVGFLLMTRDPIAADGFEGRTLSLLARRGHSLERIRPAAMGSRFPAWNVRRYRDGYLNPTAGFVESGRCVAWLLRRAESRGVAFRGGVGMRRLLESDVRVTGIETTDGERIEADLVLVAAGAWTPNLLPGLRERVRAVAQPVLHFRPADPEPFRAKRFPVWAADISRTGWYGFPVNADGIVKVAHHGPGYPSAAGGTDEPDDEIESRFRAFLAHTFPGLADAPRVGGRFCFYCDSPDARFWVGPHPERPGLALATGGSGHAFKFAPVLGAIVADAVEGRPNRFAERFAWRRVEENCGEEARFVG